MAINIENCRKWIAALRSGVYWPCKNQLRHDDTFCPLGVACDISGLGDWHGWTYQISYTNATFVMPDEVLNWLGIDNSYPRIISDLNDTCDYSFLEIADRIEFDYPELKLEESVVVEDTDIKEQVIITLDSRRRVSLAKVGHKDHNLYLVEETENGVITLRPVAIVPLNYSLEANDEVEAQQ